MNTKVYIGFSKPKNHIFPIFSWLIRFWDKTPYSHVYIRWYSRGAKVDIVYHAAGSMVHFMCKKFFLEKAELIEEYELEVPREQYSELVQFSMQNAGVGYGVKQVFGIALQRIFNLKKNPFADGAKTQVCNEIAGRLLEKLGYEIDMDYDTASPKDMNDLMKKLNMKQTL